MLHATKRTKKVKALRASGAIPAVVYGHGIPTEEIALPFLEFAHAYRAAGESTLLDVSIDGAASRKVLVHDVQRDPLTEQLLHVDLYAVRMTEKMKTKIPLQFTGEAPAVKERGGLLVKNLDHIAVSCLPEDLVPAIVLDVRGLTAFGQSIYVKDIPAPKGITILEKPSEPVVTVMKPKTEEELAAELAAEVPKEVKVEEIVKVQEKGKKEEEGEGGAAQEKEGAKAREKEEKPAGGKEKKEKK